SRGAARARRRRTRSWLLGQQPVDQQMLEGDPQVAFMDILAQRLLEQQLQFRNAQAAHHFVTHARQTGDHRIAHDRGELLQLALVDLGADLYGQIDHRVVLTLVAPQIDVDLLDIEELELGQVQRTGTPLYPIRLAPYREEVGNGLLPDE